MEVNIKKIKISDLFPDNNCLMFSKENGFQNFKTKEAFANKKIVIFSNPGLFVASYMASQIPTFESNYKKIRELGVDEIFCLINNDCYVTANYSEKFRINNIKFICDNDLVLTNSLGYLADFSDLKIGYRCWPIMMYLVNGQVFKLFYEDFAVMPIDCYSNTSSITMINYLQEIK